MAAKTKGPPAFIKDDSTSTKQIPDNIALKVRKKAAEARAIEREMEDLEAQLKQRKADYLNIIHTQLPDLLDEIGMDRFTLRPIEDFPAMDFRLTPDYRANIAAGWPPEKRQAAFNWLDENGHGDLIKTVVEVPFPRDKRTQVQKFQKMLDKQGFSASTKESVSHQTLTAWLREQVESGNPLPPLDLLGAWIGRVVKMKEIKE